MNIKKLVLVFLFSTLLILLNGCQGLNPPVPVENNDENEVMENDDIHINSYLLLSKGNTGIIKDCTPEFTVLTEKADVKSMSFSGNGKDWSNWVPYAENYDQFNIASGLYGTTMNSETKSIYVRFQDQSGNIFPYDFQETPCCTFEYEMQQLFSIKIDPNSIEMEGGTKQVFTIKGYDLLLNEVPLDGQKIEWSKPCGSGELNPIKGLTTTYTAPNLSGSVKNISAHYGSLGTGAKIYIK